MLWKSNVPNLPVIKLLKERRLCSFVFLIWVDIPLLLLHREELLSHELTYLLHSVLIHPNVYGILHKKLHQELSTTCFSFAVSLYVFFFIFTFSGAAAVNVDSFHLSKGISNVTVILNHIYDTIHIWKNVHMYSSPKVKTKVFPITNTVV